MPGLFDGTPLEQAVTCESCRKPLEACHCPRSKDGTIRRPSDQHPRVRREKRRGKWATVVSDLHPEDAKTLLKKLKATLGTGGGLTPNKQGGDDLIFQGDHQQKVVDALKKLGYQAKPGGG
ncbi:MAG: translation initiation factor [Planctomycetota bacterium]